jgi:hypothetical protein
VRSYTLWSTIHHKESSVLFFATSSREKVPEETTPGMIESDSKFFGIEE